MNQAKFLIEIERLTDQLGELIDRTHAEAPPTVEWVAMLTWASCARGSLMSLAELGIPDSATPLAPSPSPSPSPSRPYNPLECKLCTRLRALESEFCDRHAGGQPVPEDYKAR